MANALLAQASLLLMSLIVSANGLKIHSVPETVRPDDKDVRLSCSGGDDTQALDQVYRMRLMRLDDDDQWSEVAALRYDGNIEVSDEAATAVGELGDVSDSYLFVTWPVAPPNVNSKYRCDAIALSSKGEVVKEQSKDLDLKSLTGDMALVLERLEKSDEKLIEEVNHTMHGAVRSSNINLLSVIESKFGNLMEYLDNKTAQPPEEEVESMHWPEGEFTFLMPDSGCPLHPPAWVKSFQKSRAGPEDKYYPMDSPRHLAKPHRKDGFIFRQFCTLPATDDRHQPWPAGCYCLNSMPSSSCPSGFERAEARIEVIDDLDNFYLFYSPTSPQTSGYFVKSSTGFCCRHDSSPLTPIELPSSHPFYLVRHGSRCQEVKGMDVSQDIFMMETGDEDEDYDDWSDTDEDYHPDVTFHPYKEELCYYSKSRS